MVNVWVRIRLSPPQSSRRLHNGIVLTRCLYLNRLFGIGIDMWGLCALVLECWGNFLICAC